MKGLAKDLGRLVGKERVRTAPEDLFAYGGDATYYVKRGKPNAVVLPENTSEVSEVMKYAFHNAIPVTPRGAGSGLVGGAIGDGKSASTADAASSETPNSHEAVDRRAIAPGRQFQLLRRSSAGVH